MSKSISFALACSLAAFTGADRVAFAQAGSAGGTLGKTDKSASGGEQDKAARSRERSGKMSLDGTWIWHATCPDGTDWKGEFKLEEKSDGSLAGTCSVYNGGGGSCSEVSGQVSGNKATFSVKWSNPLYSHWNPYSLTILPGGQSMRGTEKAQRGICQYQVTRQ
jgi:hypothetical protein